MTPREKTQAIISESQQKKQKERCALVKAKGREHQTAVTKAVEANEGRMTGNNFSQTRSASDLALIIACANKDCELFLTGLCTMNVLLGRQSTAIERESSKPCCVRDGGPQATASMRMRPSGHLLAHRPRDRISKELCARLGLAFGF